MKTLALLYNKLIHRHLVRFRLRAVGRSFKLGYSSELLNPHLFTIGDEFFSGPYCYFVTNPFSPVCIGSHVMFGPFCRIIGGNHDYTYSGGHLSTCKQPQAYDREIVIEDGVWIGAGSTLLTGTYIGEGAIIGSMGLVRHYITPYTIAVGLPATKYFSRFPSDADLESLLRNIASCYTVKEIRRIQREHGVSIKAAYNSPMHSS